MKSKANGKRTKSNKKGKNKSLLECPLSQALPLVSLLIIVLKNPTIIQDEGIPREVKKMIIKDPIEYNHVHI